MWEGCRSQKGSEEHKVKVKSFALHFVFSIKLLWRFPHFPVHYIDRFKERIRGQNDINLHFLQLFARKKCYNCRNCIKQCTNDLFFVATDYEEFCNFNARPYAHHDGKKSEYVDDVLASEFFEFLPFRGIVRPHKKNTILCHYLKIIIINTFIFSIFR